jgi:hypothetical protein
MRDEQENWCVTKMVEDSGESRIRYKGELGLIIFSLLFFLFFLFIFLFLPLPFPFFSSSPFSLLFLHLLFPLLLSSVLHVRTRREAS